MLLGRPGGEGVKDVEMKDDVDMAAEAAVAKPYSNPRVVVEGEIREA